MMLTRIFLLLATLILSACANLYERQYPAPVYTPPRAQTYPPPPVAQPYPPPPMPPTIEYRRPEVTIAPIPEFKPNLEPITPPPIQAINPPIIAPVPESGIEALSGIADASAAEVPPVANVQSPASAIVPVKPPVAAPVAERIALTPFEPIEPSASTSPAIGALMTSANRNSRSGNLDSAIATIERARNIEPSNAGIYYKLALLRVKQGKSKLAEELAKKAALLARNDRQLKKHSWLLIAHARELQKDFAGAKVARAKAGNF